MNVQIMAMQKTNDKTNTNNPTMKSNTPHYYMVP
jgi:hypothetical protein